MAKQTSLADTSMLSSKLNLLHDANFPRDPEGRVYHLGVKRGEGIFIAYQNIKKYLK